MKVAYEIYRKYKAFEFLPRVAFFWFDLGIHEHDIEISWLSWGIDIEFHRDNSACR